MKYFIIALGLVTLITSGQWASAQQAEPELRAAWVSRFEWPQGSESADKAKIQNVMQTLAANNFNAVLFQVRGECDTLYPSPYEPWAPQYNWTDPGWDPMAYAIEQAHANGIKFYAYINTHTISTTIPPESTVPQHVYHLYGDPAVSPNWQIHGSDHQPAGFHEYYWLSPGVPDAEYWTRRAIMHVVENYDVDGLHFDRIRTPGPEYSQDPISQARFSGEGNPDGEGWGDWMRSQFTRQLRKIYGDVNRVKPHVVITAAPFGICKKEPGGYQGAGTQSFYSWYQDSFGWMENHVLDAVFPMIYWEIGSAHPFEVLLGDFMNHTGGRHIYSGMHVSNNVPGQITETRNQNAHGGAIFSFNRINFSELASGVYSEPAPAPELSWKTNPTTGIIVGWVLEQGQGPVVDATVNRQGDSYNYLSGADGFFSILDVPPGAYEITAEKAGFGTLSATVSVTAGEVVEVTLTYQYSKGALLLDQDEYQWGETVGVTLQDGDLAGDLSAEVTVESTLETTPETLSLSASGSSGTFEGTLLIEGGAPVPDGVLQARLQDSITVAYQDAFDGTGPAVTTAAALVRTPTQFIIDNGDPGYSETGDGWDDSSYGNNYGTDKRFNWPGDGSRMAHWYFAGIPGGQYEVEFWVNDNDYAADAHYYIEHDHAPGGGQLVLASQNYVGDGWRPLGAYPFSGGAARISVSDFWGGTGVYVVADAMRLTLQPTEPGFFGTY